MRAHSLMSLLACVAMLALPLAVASAEPMKPSGAMEAVMSDDPSDFYESAASANQFEIEASKLALDKSKDAEIRSFAETMVKEHTEIAQKLTNLATSRNVDLPTQLLKRHQMMLDSLGDADAGPAFDDRYRMNMVLSHKEAVSLFDQSAKESPDPEIRKFALSMLTQLQMHGGRAKKMEDAAKAKK